MRGQPPSWVIVVLAATSCVYFNSMYDANQDYELAVKRSREGREVEARTRYDSVIAITDRIVKEHPESEYAAPAALLKARSEIARRLWESAAATAARVPALTSDSSMIGVAAGLEGIARRADAQGAELREAERLLTRALESGPSAEDSAQFLFHRGLARLDLGDAEAAAADLEAVSSKERLSADVQLDLARGLADVGQYDRAIQLTEGLIAGNRYANFGPGMDAHLDSLVRRAPDALFTALGHELDVPDPTGTKLALLHYYRGYAREIAGDPEGALAEYDLAREGSGRGRYAAEANYRWARLRIEEARTPDDVLATRDALRATQGIIEADVVERVQRLSSAVIEFGHLVDAYETRGATAAEAALRAAELAGSELGSRRVARGLYLKYLELAPDSPWRAKAMAGAILYADYPAGEWAGDRGAATDRRLEDQLAGLPADDPYRISFEDLPRTPRVDSAYVAQERDLQRRLVQIRMLYDTTAVLITPSDTAPAENPAPAADGEDGQVAF
ncbi:MAG: hypothetical protein PVF05_09315 [Gemmatimonadales bacterium]|jgi:tetratricopeptide (TPR) repeat protein